MDIKCEKCESEVIDYDDYWTYIEDDVWVKVCKKCYDEWYDS